jgi:hypothetical protein
MVDDNEIRSLIRRESESFLDKALKQVKLQQGTTYDFETEFRKTKKNRSIIVLAATLGTIAVLGGAAFGVTRIIQAQTAATPVDVRAFEDLNLKDLLDTAKRNEREREDIKQEITKLEYELKQALETADRDYAAQVETIKAGDFDAATEKAKLAAALSDYEARKKKIRADNAAAIAKKNAQLAAIQEKIDKYDRRLMDQAQKQKELLDNAQRLYDMEKKKQTDYYEGRIAEIQRDRDRDIASLKKQRDDLVKTTTNTLIAKYNPTFTDTRSDSLLGGWKAPKASEQKAIPPYLEKGGFVEAGGTEKLDRSLSDLRYIAGKMKAVPYINSVPPALSRMESEALSSIAEYRESLVAASTGLQGRDKKIAELEAAVAALEGKATGLQAIIDRYSWAVSTHAQDNREGGYVLDPRNPEKMPVAVNPTVAVQAGTKGYIVRGEKVVASIEFGGTAASPTARITEIEQGEALRPFDVILVDASQSASK